jgi:hypothetical protein
MRCARHVLATAPQYCYNNASNTAWVRVCVRACVRACGEAELAIRGDPHVLIVGDPGLGKSQMLRAAATVHPRGVYVCGNTATKSGLTGDHRYDMCTSPPMPAAALRVWVCCTWGLEVDYICVGGCSQSLWSETRRPATTLWKPVRCPVRCAPPVVVILSSTSLCETSVLITQLRKGATDEGRRAGARGSGRVLHRRV